MPADDIPQVIEATDDAGTLHKSHVIHVEAGGLTTQKPEDVDLGTPDDAIPPPESLDHLATWSAINQTRRSCIAAMATNTVGLGYGLEVADGHEDDEESDPRQVIATAAAALEAVARRDTRLERPSFTALVSAVKVDEEEVGTGYIEVSRNRLTGKIDGLFHLPGKRMRRRRDRKAYMLLPPSGDHQDATTFAPFGTKVEYDAQGQPTRQLADGHEGGWQRNEVIVFRLYSSESRDYGMPRDAALAVEYLGDKLANESNAAFFENGGTLPTVLFVQGEEKAEQNGTVDVKVPAETVQAINATLKSKGGGPSGTSRLAIIPLPKGIKAQKEVLGQVDNRDMGFVSYRDDMRQRTLSAFRISPIFIALMGDGGQYGAEVERAITKEQVFDGEQTRYEERLAATVLRDLGYPQLALRFHDLAVEDDQTRRASADSGAEVGTITRREWRNAHGYAPIPEAAKADAEIEWGGGTYKSAEPEPGQVPFGWNDEIVNVGRPDGAENRVPPGEGQQGLRPGLGGRASRDDGQAASAAQAGRMTETGRRRAKGAAKRAVERARTLPADD